MTGIITNYVEKVFIFEGEFTLDRANKNGFQEKSAYFLNSLVNPNRRSLDTAET